MTWGCHDIIASGSLLQVSFVRPLQLRQRQSNPGRLGRMKRAHLVKGILATPPQEIRPYSGFINHWFPLIRPY